MAAKKTKKKASRARERLGKAMAKVRSGEADATIQAIAKVAKKMREG